MESASSSTKTSSMENKGRKRRLRRQKWERCRKQLKRNSGKEIHVTESGKKYRVKYFKMIKNCCNNMCYKLFNRHAQQVIFNQFWDGGDKQIQDTFLISCVSKRPIKYARAVVLSKKRNNSWEYHLKNGGVQHKICKQFLLLVLQIDDSRMKTVLRYCESEKQVAEENRGKHMNRPNRIPDEIWQMVKEHWASLPHRESHYSRNRTKRKFFDNPTLNVINLYSLFKQHYLETTGSHLNMKYGTYHKYFRSHCDFSFSIPKTDVCDYCTECKAALSINPGHECEASFLHHKNNIAEYEEIKKKILNDARNITEDDTLIIEFDYGQNQPLPKLNVTAQFYKRLLWLYVFNVHCFNDGSSKLYCFLETDGRKNANSVCSFLDDFISDKLNHYKNLKKIILFSDSCGGQNKNITVLQFCSWLAIKNNITLTHIFPVRGHSYCQCDRNFGLYGTLLKKTDIIENAMEYVDIMKAARKNPEPFDVIMASYLLKDWSEGLAELFMKVPKLKKERFSIQKYVKMTISSDGKVSVFRRYCAQDSQVFEIVKKGIVFNRRTKLRLPVTLPPKLKNAKKNDVLTLLKFLKPENAEWFRNILSHCACDETGDREISSDSD